MDAEASGRAGGMDAREAWTLISLHSFHSLHSFLSTTASAAFKATSASDPMEDSTSSSHDTPNEERHHVYIVECSDGTLYTGYTTDVERRVREHNEGTAAKYTRGRRPVTLVHTEAYATQSAAMRREYRIKQLRRPEKERLIEKV